MTLMATPHSPITWEKVLEKLHPGERILRLSVEHITITQAILENILRADGCNTDVTTGRTLLEIITALGGPGLDESRMVATELALESCLTDWESWIKHSPTPAVSVNEAALDHIAAVRKLLKK